MYGQVKSIEIDFLVEKWANATANVTKSPFEIGFFKNQVKSQRFHCRSSDISYWSNMERKTSLQKWEFDFVLLAEIDSPK